MKNYSKIYILLVISLIFAACDKQVLDLNSLTEPVSTTFFSNEAELQLALTGIYNSLIRTDYGVAYQMGMDNGGSDIGISRGCAFDDMGAGSQSATTGTFQSLYSYYYVGISRANNLIVNMSRAKSVVPKDNYNLIRAEAFTLRAYFYHYLTEFFGDVPYINVVASSPKEGLLPRTPKSVVVDSMLADLQTASAYLPLKATKGRLTKGAALGLRARIALYNGRYTEAAASAKDVMDLEATAGYSLYSDYKNLFQRAGEGCPEIMFSMPFQDGFITATYGFPLGSRNCGGYTTMAPTQSMIDSYEATDGLPIDKSTVYSPSKPFDNRDPRLKASIVTPQSQWAGFIYESHPDSLNYRFIGGKLAGKNNDCRTVSWPASFCGYMWKKYDDEAAQSIKQLWTDIDFSLLRYAEVLLTYSEAKIELGQIDASVLNAINRVRARAYGVSITNTGSYPAITTTNQSELRTIIRRERKVELANEGFRMFDIRRWKIAEKVMPVTIYGRILDEMHATLIPTIDNDCFVSYGAVKRQYDLNTDARFPNAQNRKFNNQRDYLCPIPQAEIDTYKGFGITLEQNPGY